MSLLYEPLDPQETASMKTGNMGVVNKLNNYLKDSYKDIRSLKGIWKLYFAIFYVNCYVP